jgi:hypothetical protein
MAPSAAIAVEWDEPEEERLVVPRVTASRFFRRNPP